MSKQITFAPAAPFIKLTMCALLFVAYALTVVAQSAIPQSSPTAAAVAAVNPKSAGVMAATADVLRETSEIRKLEVMRPVRSGAQSRAEIERMLIKNLDADTTPAEMRATELDLKKLGLVAADFQYRTFLVKLLTEQVAGYYDPLTQQFYLADWIDLNGQKPVIAHELTHALQDQHFNLRRFEKWPKGDADAELAAHSLVEGDATLVMSFYVLRDLTRAAAMMKSMIANPSANEQIDHAPRALRDNLLFPYERGLTWVTELYRRGGWPLVSQAFTELPQSTEQILHPDKYFAREAPIKVSLPDLSAALGANWQRLDDDVRGEWGYYELLDEFLQSEPVSQKAAAGWGGDRYSLYENPKTGEVLLSQLSVWDTEQDAREFFDAYAARTARRYKDASAVEQSNDDAAPPRRAWNTSEGAVVLERHGTRVAILEGLPKNAKPKKLMAMMWAQK